MSRCTESERIGTVFITNDMLGGENVLGSNLEGVKSFSSEKGYFALIFCFSGHNDLLL